MEEIVSDLELVRKGIISSQNAEKINSKLKQICANDDVIAQIKKLELYR